MIELQRKELRIEAAKIKLAETYPETYPELFTHYENTIRELQDRINSLEDEQLCYSYNSDY